MSENKLTNYLIEGAAGTGKTTIGYELTNRGFGVIHADDVFGRVNHYGKWIWDNTKLHQTMWNKSGVYVVGGSDNQDQYWYYFKRIFLLYASEAVLKNRLLYRTNNEFGKNPTDLKTQLKFNKMALAESRRTGKIPINADFSPQTVVGEILKYK